MQALEKRERLRVAALLALSICVVYANVVFGGRSLVASENYNPMDPRPVDSSYGPQRVPHETWTSRGLFTYAGFHDPGGAWWQWEPSAHFFRQALKRGEMPFWDPYVGAGAPSMANLMPAYFFPPYLLMVLLGATSLLKNFYALALLFGAGFFTYLFLRRHDLGFVGAGFGALAFTLSGALNQALTSFIGQTAACLPFALWLTRAFLDRPDTRRTACLALGYACVALASFPPLLVLLFGFVGLYAAVEIARARLAGPRAAGVALRFVLGALLSFGLVGFYYLPALRLIAISEDVRGLYASAARDFLPRVTLLQLLSPDLLGGGQHSMSPAVPDPFPWHVPAVGAVIALAALLAWRGGPPRRDALAWLATGTALLIVAKLVGAPGVQELWRLPVLRSVHFAVYAPFLLHFLLALLAGVGLDRLARGELSRRHAWLVCGALALLLLGLLVAARAHGLALGPALVDWAFRYAVMTALALCACAAVVGAGSRRAPRAARAACAALGLLALAEGVLNLGWPRQKRHDVWRHPVPFVSALRGLADGRSFADYRVLPANTNSAFGVFGIDSLMSFNSQRLTRLYRRYFKGPPQQFMREMAELPPEPLLDRAGIGFFGVRTELVAMRAEALRRGYAQSYQDDWATLFRRPSGLRYLVTPDWRLVTAEHALAESGHAPSLRVLLEEAPGFAARPFDPRAEARVLFFRNNAYALEVRSPGPALLYCAESHMPGWEARVDGRPARILAANYAFRALEVPAGRTRVELRYVPPGWRAGLALSGASLLLVAGLGLRRSSGGEATAA